MQLKVLIVQGNIPNLRQRQGLSLGEVKSVELMREGEEKGLTERRVLPSGPWCGAVRCGAVLCGAVRRGGQW